MFAQGAAHLGDGVLCREPPIDALMMELVVTQWQYRNPLLRLQGGKAYDALDGVALISIDVWEWRVVREHRETEEDGGWRVEGDIANLAWRVVTHTVNPEDAYEEVDAGEYAENHKYHAQEGWPVPIHQSLFKRRCGWRHGDIHLSVKCTQD